MKTSASSSKTIDNLSSKIEDFKVEINHQRDIKECISSHLNELDEIEKEHNFNQQRIEMLKKEIADLEAQDLALLARVEDIQAKK